MKKLDEVLNQAIAQREVLRAARARRALKHWDNVVGETLAIHSVPENWEQGTLWVSASGSAWAQELRMHADSILERLNALADEKLFTSLRVGVRPPRRNLSEDTLPES